MKFEKVVRGKRAEELLEVPGYKDEEGKPWTILLVPLTGLEWETASADARARAVEKGVPNPGMGDPIYDIAVMAFILFAGCMDPDSPPDARVRTFNSGVQILDKLHPEMIVYLHERHELHQLDCSPNVYKIVGGDAGLHAAVAEVAGPEGRATFMRWSPNTRLGFTISMARLLKEHWDTQKLKSISISSSSEIEKSESSETPNEREPSFDDADLTKLDDPLTGES
jgi:hypothetical protein